MTELPEGTAAHRADAARFATLRAAVLTVTDSRTLATDLSGDRLRDGLTAAGHTVVARDLLPNDEARVRAHVEQWLGREDLDVIVITGGTGLGSRDRTIEAVRPLLEKEIPGFGELFRLLGYQEQVGTAAMLSRATAGSAHGKLVVSLPGSAAAVGLALERLILPEAAHLLREIRR
ncbi:MAG: MogA/MoaB family molybdenum cofactor biosynthesis protein [Gemmatimonadota bacterium]|jgi:molybdenum cofactor biosynthesis protein B|nr:MogA/MoaB family molybdenum cofactor biosynthesis protein [Gemmatimonadota bacterium]MDQ8146277.1 MogA/MoaB family molybdenum cofactor biosynthesis protein [Gemmatimonadota bacterium]MDQ8148213.1 MogA/MoaB family molybdenum cofactor biosynthesis protein [Gemmatimonadota bacterium]MDQ8156800.1 MogA/MoaB family molybdenum cofactor biosynthesis protein [Gemmatimonadota bacterium]MDQ8175750.1 MogA/MoaB family molybdenum cofactor biosynthesis protein [Gemmatimonadota bacterium]